MYGFYLDMIRLSFIMFFATTLVSAAASAEEFRLQERDLEVCQNIVSGGTRISQDSIRNVNTSYWASGDKIFRIAFSSLNKFSVRISCEEVLTSE